LNFVQAAVRNYGGNRMFPRLSENHPDYNSDPPSPTRLALMEGKRAYAEAQAAKKDEDEQAQAPHSTVSRQPQSKTKAETPF